MEGFLLTKHIEGGFFMINECQILDEKSISRAITRISHEIIEKNKGVNDVVLIC